MHVSIYADGGATIGYGHLVRTNALAKEAIKQGYKVTYLTSTPQTTEAVVSDEMDLIATERPEDTIEVLASLNIDVLVTDSYDIDHKLQRQLSKIVPKLAVVMDRHPHSIHCDILVNGNLYAETLEYKWTGSEPIWCLGPDYLLLREEVRQYTNCEAPWRDPPESALVTMGGSDGENMTPKAIRAFNDTDLTVEVIVGPGFSNHSEIEIAASEVNCDVVLVNDPNDLPARMFQSDLAVSALGTTVYELLATGTPFIGVQTAANQALTASCLQERKLALVTESTTDAIACALDHIHESAERRRIRKAASQLITADSVTNVAEQVLP